MGRRMMLFMPILLAGCTASRSDLRVGHELSASAGAVVSVDRLASEIGARVLVSGGSAVDAAVATAFALAVCWPEAGNLGGGGFMLVRPSGGPPVFIDYRERAPLGARPEMFLREDGSVEPFGVRLGFLPVGVPGTVAGLFLAHQLYGRLPWRELVLPAARLAERGFRVSATLAESIAEHADELSRCEVASAVFLDGGGRPLPAGARLVQTDLGGSLRRIAERGADAFYRGEIAKRIVADSEQRGGILTLDDFERYLAVVREPVVGHYRGVEVLAGPPPTSGGAVLIESLNQLEGFDLSALGAGSAEELHLLVEVQRRSFLDRARSLGDPDFVSNPLDRLLDKQYAADLRRGIDRSRASSSDVLAGDLDGTLLPAESEQTTHFSVVDAEGNAVSNTYTLEESWGAKTMARGTGILLNNEMHDFNVRPGVSTRAGRIGTGPNRIEPGKRMLSSMCPVILTRKGRLLLVAGSPGGRTIPSTVLRVVTGVVDHGLSPEEAVALPRVHHGLYPDVVSLERSVGERARAGLREKGHKLRIRKSQGDCHAIGVDPRTGQLQAAADHRRAGSAAGPR